MNNNEKNKEKLKKSNKGKKYISTTNMNDYNNLNRDKQNQGDNNIKENYSEVDDTLSEISNIFTDKNLSEFTRIIMKNAEDCRDDIKRIINNKCYQIDDKIEKQSSNKYCIEIKNKVCCIDEKIGNLVEKEENKIFYEQLNKIVKDTYSKIEYLEKMTINLMKNIEVIEGSLNRLNNIENIKDISQRENSIILNQQKNNKLRPSNLEEEVLMNLGEYGEKIIKELTLASRHYAINKDKIENARELEEKYQKELILRKEEYKKEGKFDIVESICEKYEDLDTIFEPKTMEGGIIKRILIDGGIEKLEEYSSGRIIEITKENRVDLEGKVRFSHDSLGVYKITKSAYELNGNIKQKAEVEKIEE